MQYYCETIFTDTEDAFLYASNVFDEIYHCKCLKKNYFHWLLTNDNKILGGYKIGKINNIENAHIVASMLDDEYSKHSKQAKTSYTDGVSLYLVLSKKID